MEFFNLRTGIAVAFAAFICGFTGASAQSPVENGQGLAAALSAASEGKWNDATQIAARNQDPIAAEIIEWTRLRDGRGTFEDYEAFLSVNSDWPGLPLLQKVSEENIPENIAPARILQYFNTQKPQTGWGALRLAKAYDQLGQSSAAVLEVVHAWRAFSLSAEEQNALWKAYANSLQPHNADRLDLLLWKRKNTEAGRMLALVSQEQRRLAEVRIALQRDKSGVDAMIAALPTASRNSAGLAYDRFRWRVSQDYWDSAHDMLVERSSSPESLGRPEFWSDRRRTYARRAMRAGDHKTAYYLASRNYLTPEQSDYADLEWLSGYLALRKLDDPALALKHFENFHAAIASPISKGRAGYWLGRTFEEMGNPQAARDAYAMAATFQTSFYGQLAAERAGLTPDQSIAGNEIPPDWTKEAFLGSDSVRAGFLFHFAGEPRLVRRFLTHASESMTVSQRAAIGQLALDLGSANTALKIAKTAATDGTVIPLAYYPITELADIDSPVSPELALAIARQESEFDPSAQSSVGALGLMQVMPATGKSVARDLGVSFSSKKLGGDWEYNALLGTAYLADMLKRFNGSTLLAAAAYNAGPHRADRWIKDYGDPRTRNVDAIDWIEAIPYRETRNYVMRVNEALFVYRARLTGTVPDMSLTESLNGR